MFFSDFFCEHSTLDIREKDALETYDKVINLNLDKTYDEVVAIGALYNSDAWYNKAGIESMRKNKKQALEHLRIAISLNKKSKENDNIFVHNFGNLYYNINDLKYNL